MRKELRRGGLVALLTLGGGCHLLLGLDEYRLEEDLAVCNADGVRNEDETDVDCGGGVCPPCADQRGCAVGTDCKSGVCTGGRCVAPGCDDKIKNGDEIDVDCGGNCGACGPGKACGKNEDCKSGVCTGGTCQSTCTDLVKGGQETDVDCGGPDCPACPNDNGCATGSDCESGVCKAGVCLDHHVWSKAFKGMGNADASRLAIDGGGNAVLTGNFDGTIDFDGTPHTASGTSQDIYVARFAPSGDHLWSKSFGDSDYQLLLGLDLSKSGDIFISGALNGTTDFGGGALTANGQSDAFYARLNSSGKYLIAGRYGDSQSQYSSSVAVDGDGNMILVGGFSGKMTFSTGTTVTSAGGEDIFVTRSTDTSTGKWIRRFGDSSDQHPYGVDVDSSNNLVMIGYMAGTVDFGGGPLSALGPRDIFLVKLGPAGNQIWSKHFGSTTADIGAISKVDESDNVVVAGYVTGALDMGGGQLPEGGAQDVFIAKFDMFGNHLWSKRFGGAEDQAAFNIALDSTGNIFVIGAFSGTIDFGGKSMTSTGGTDVFVAKFNRSGEYLWSRSFGDADYQYGMSIAASDEGNVLIAGKFSGTIDFGGGPFTSTDGGDIFLAKLRTP